MSETHAEHAHHVISNKVLNRTFGALLFFMVATIFFARLPIDGPKYFPGFDGFFHTFQSIWPLTNLIAIGIAVWKLVLVIQNFMGVKYASGLVRLWAVAGFVGFALMFTMMFDYAGRALEPVKGWEKSNSTAFPRERETEAGVPYKQYPGHEEGEASKE